MHRTNGKFNIATAPIDSKVELILADNETIEQVYNRLNPKPDILINGNMYDMNERKFVQGVKIGNEILCKANYGGHLFIANNGKYKIEQRYNIEVKCDFAIEGLGMIKPYNIRNIHYNFINGYHERTTIGFNEEVIKVISTNSEANFSELEKIANEEDLDFCLNLDGGGSVGLIADGELLINSTRQNLNYLAIYYPKKKHIFILDAGHEHETPGKRTPDNSMREFEFNDYVTKGVGKELSKYENVEVYYSNKENSYDTLSDRTNFANDIYNKNKQDSELALISFHANASDDYDDDKDGWYKAGGISTFVYGFRFKKAYELAKTIQSELVKATGLRDRGTMEADFHMTRETLMTAVVIEHGFMTNRKEAELLKSEAYRQKCIKADTAAITKFYNLRTSVPQIKKATKVVYNGKELKAYINENNRTVVEVRELAELLGFYVHWNGEYVEIK